MKSLMNRFHNRRLQQPAAVHVAGSTFRELTHQETTTVSGGLVPVLVAAVVIGVGAAIVIGATGVPDLTPSEDEGRSFQDWFRPRF